MSKQGSRQDRTKTKRPPRFTDGGYTPPQADLLHTVPRTQRSRKALEAQTDAQSLYMNQINCYDLIFCRGPMGTGKTYVAAAKAAEALEKREIDKIIVTRPAVEAEESYGALPGELEEKWAPFFAPVRKILEERLGAGTVEMMLKNGKIEIAPIGFLRGHTFNDCWVLFDEAQNATPKQMKLFLTRIGKNCKVIVDGDPDEQMDIQGQSGFADAWDRMWGHPQVGYVTFDVDDIVRSGLSRDILLRYRKSPQEVTVGQAGLGRYLGVGQN